MPRCIICNHCSETDADDGRKFAWNKEKLGYECQECRYDYFNRVREDYSGEVAYLDDAWDDVEPDEFLEESEVDADSGGS